MDGQSDLYYPLSDVQMVVDYKSSGWITKEYTEKALEHQYSVEIQFFNVGKAYVNFRLKF